MEKSEVIQKKLYVHSGGVKIYFFYIFTSENIKYTLYFINIFLYFVTLYIINNFTCLISGSKSAMRSSCCRGSIVTVRVLVL